MANRFDEHQFRKRVNSCLSSMKLILDSQKTSTLGVADQVSHSYEDKYLLAVFLTNTAAVCSMNCLKTLGMDERMLKLVKQWSAEKDVQIEFSAFETCEFLHEKSREEDSKSKVVVNYGSGSVASKVVNTITEYFYRFTVKYQINLVKGVGSGTGEKVTLQGREAKQEICLRAKKMPYAEKNSRSHSVNISWLLRNLADDLSCFKFGIDRSHPDCHTPACNTDVSNAEKFFQELEGWATNVSKYFVSTLIPIQQSHQPNCKIDMNQLTNAEVFVPVVPLMNNISESNAASPQLVGASSEGSSSQTLVPADAQSQQQLIVSANLANQLLSEEARSLSEKCTQMRQLLPSPLGCSALATAAEAAVLVVCTHLKNVIVHYVEGIQFIEHMLRQQLIAAVGKELQPSDFAEYMRFHNRKIFRDQYQPGPFTLSVRRSALHSPEGTVRIEDNKSDAIYTVCRSSAAAESHLMEFPLNAATKVKFGGERHLHAWLAHSFSGQSVGELKLVAQARQFSSFIVLIGRIAGPSLFEPKHGFIVQNKDEMSIPLWLEQIPTPKEFKKAVSSISPEQQQFAQAIRSMQLESTLFGVCVIQIKPQLEKVLKLSADSLTKEIQLTQDLMKLFIEYQIPTDLISFEGSESAGSVERLEKVRGHVAAMNEMLKKAKEAEIEKKNQERLYATGAAAAAAMPSVSVSYSARMSCSMMKKEAEEEDDDCGRGIDLFDGDCDDSECGYDEEECEEVCSSGDDDNASENTAKDAQDPTNEKDKDTGMDIEESSKAKVVDYTKYPTMLDKNYEKHDPDSALRPTIIKVGDTWTKKAQAALLTAASTKTLYSSEQTTERTAAFDLLDALSRSGALTIDDASLHVVIATTHCFDKSLMNTVVQKNVNPIERVERSTLIMASTIHGVDVNEVVLDSQVTRLQLTTPSLFIKDV